jgi:CheY-like chemotaxis protein
MTSEFMDHQDLEQFYLGTEGDVMDLIITRNGQLENAAQPWLRELPQTATTGSQNTTKPVVLILEDFDAIRAWTAHHLEQKGYDVYSAATLHAAIQLAKEQEPQLVLIDYDMSGEDAIWAIGQLRSLAPNAFILVLGGPGTAIVEHHAIEAGATQVLPHAYDTHLLDDIIAHSAHGLERA